MQPIGLVFDLDDTLYLERDFARSGFAAAGDWLRKETGAGGLSDICWDIFCDGERTRIFDQALTILGREPDPALIELLVDIYRTHEPAIALAPDAERYLSTIPNGSLTALITDGPAATQQAKIKALGLDKIIDFIVCTDALGKGFGKPHLRPFELVEKWAAASVLPLVYVADNPLKDFVTPRARGWLTVQIKRPQRVHIVDAPDAHHQADFGIEGLDELDDCLTRARGGVIGGAIFGSPAGAPRSLPGSV
jgi:putative hydrolase of the HAD superfamily